MKTMALITEFSMPTGFYWAQRARSYITKHQAEINEKYNKQKPRNISEGKYIPLIFSKEDFSLTSLGMGGVMHQRCQHRPYADWLTLFTQYI